MELRKLPVVRLGTHVHIRVTRDVHNTRLPQSSSKTSVLENPKCELQPRSRLQDTSRHEYQLQSLSQLSITRARYKSEVDLGVSVLFFSFKPDMLRPLLPSGLQIPEVTWTYLQGKDTFKRRSGSIRNGTYLIERLNVCTHSVSTIPQVTVYVLDEV